jgi:hypothetical protein
MIGVGRELVTSTLAITGLEGTEDEKEVNMSYMAGRLSCLVFSFLLSSEILHEGGGDNGEEEILHEEGDDNGKEERNDGAEIFGVVS